MIETDRYRLELLAFEPTMRLSITFVVIPRCVCRLGRRWCCISGNVGRGGPASICSCAIPALSQSTGDTISVWCACF